MIRTSIIQELKARGMSVRELRDEIKAKRIHKRALHNLQILQWSLAINNLKQI